MHVLAPCPHVKFVVMGFAPCNSANALHTFYVLTDYMHTYVMDIICFLVLCRTGRTHSYVGNSAAIDAGESDTRGPGGHWCWKGSERIFEGQVYKSSRSGKSSCQGLEAMYTPDLIPCSLSVTRASSIMYVRH
jgi:hypothetical protein